MLEQHILFKHFILYVQDILELMKHTLKVCRSHHAQCFRKRKSSDGDANKYKVEVRKLFKKNKKKASNNNSVLKKLMVFFNHSL